MSSAASLGLAAAPGPVCAEAQLSATRIQEPETRIPTNKPNSL